jgi:hypothetical protein
LRVPLLGLIRLRLAETNTLAYCAHIIALRFD